jgi:mannose-6-phosphate isomerase-like protein (cupin superfamily)
MADVTIKRIEELESYQNQFLYAGRGLGVTSFGMNVLRLPPNWPDYPEHNHAKEGQEEVYAVLQGSARLTAGAESWDLVPGTLVRVGAEQKRRIVPGPAGVTILALGGTPGKAYEPPARKKSTT